VSPKVETEIYYKDEDNDHVIVTFEDELIIALKSNPPVKFELVVKTADSDEPPRTATNAEANNVEVPKVPKVVETFYL